MKLKDMAAVPVVPTGVGVGVGSTGSFLHATKVAPISNARSIVLCSFQILVVDVVSKTEDETFLVRHHQRPQGMRNGILECC